MDMTEGTGDERFTPFPFPVTEHKKFVCLSAIIHGKYLANCKAFNEIEFVFVPITSPFLLVPYSSKCLLSSYAFLPILS